LGFHDSQRRVTRKATPPRLPQPVERFLLAVGSRWPAILNEGSTCTSNSLLVSRDGVFDGEKKLAGLLDVVRQTPRGEVLAISDPHHSHALLVVVIVIAGLVVARLVLGYMLAGG
jgi:hypothetical protein